MWPKGKNQITNIISGHFYFLSLMNEYNEPSQLTAELTDLWVKSKVKL